MTYPTLQSLKRFCLVLAASVALAGAASAESAVAPKKTYHLAAGDATTTLKTFTEQSGEQIVYPVDKVRGVQTKAVNGELTAREALGRMLVGSSLSVVQDEKTGAFTLQSVAATAPVAERNIPSRSAVEAAAAAKPGAEEIVQLSPFEVNSDQDKGYLATSAMSGTRLNTRLEDIAAALSVVTKQQLRDTAAVDINDLFLYEANTEGTQQWTSYTIDRGTVSDDIQANPYGATRMRGLSAANTAIDGFTSSLPFDTYNAESIEVSRGPNSSIFGLGQTGGGVNINSSRAKLTRSSSSFTTRWDSYGGFRQNFDLNRVLIKDRVAFRLLGVYDDKGFERQPASEVIRRVQGALTARPFKSTTIRASFESYRDRYNRPNSTTPRDGISDWIANGRPTYDPITQTVHFANGSPNITGVTSALETTLLPYGIAPTDTNFTTYPSAYITGGQIQRYEINAMPTATPAAGATGTGPTSVNATGLHLLTSGTFYNRFTAQYPLFVTKGMTDQSLYDWTAVNITAPNYGTQKAETSNVSFEQIFVNSARQQLTFQAAWQKERVYTESRSFLGTYGNAGGKLQVSIDINEKLLDGSTNPYFLQPYLGYPRPGFNKGVNNNDNYRATLAYQLNLTNEQGWIRHLGRHNFTGYGEFRSVHTANLGYTDTLSSQESWISANGVSANRNSAGYRFYAHYILGDANGYNVDYGAPGIKAPPYSTTLRYFNGVTNQWVNESVDFAEYFYANRPNRRLLSTGGGTWQGYFFGDRIIPTFGLRKDANRSRDANSAIGATAATDGFLVPPKSNVYGSNDWVHNSGKTTTKGIVVKPINWVHLLYNQSDSFSPGALAYDIYGQPLKDPKGKGKDYGFQFVLLGGRLSIRAQQYENVDSSRGDSTVGTYVVRALRMDGGPTAATAYPATSGDPNLSVWYGNEVALNNPTWTADQVTAEVVKQIGVDPVFIASHYGKAHGDRSDATSRGKELEITFNPNKFWTLRATGSQTLAFNGKLSGELQDYIDARMPTWTTIKGPNSGATWWTTPISGTTPSTFFLNNVLAPLKLLIATQGKQKPQIREYKFGVFSNYQLAGLTDNRWLKNLSLGGGYRWESRANVAFYGAAADPDGIVRNYDPNRPIYDKARYYVDLSAGYNLSLFKDKVRAHIQLNVKNIFEDGRLQAIGYNPDGQPFAFRIIDPRQFILSTSFDL